MPPIERLTDEQLVAALNRGDAGAFEAIYYRYRDFVHTLALRFTRDENDALDVLQETFAYLHRKFPGFVLTARLTTFLYPVVKNLAIAIRRKRSRMGAAEDAILETLTAPNVPESAGELPHVLGGLPELHREVLLMRFVDDLTLEEIAVALEIPLGTVKSRLHNALKTLRGDPRMRSYFFEE